MIDQPLTVRTLPSKAVFANSEIGVGKLRLSPVTRSVTLSNPRKKGNASNPRQQCTITCPDKRTMLVSMGSPVVDETFCNAFFVVAVTHVKELSNMTLETEEVSFILSSSSKLRIAGHEHIVKIPVFVNLSIIKEGEELLWFVEKVVSEKPPPELKGLQLKANKRAKVASKYDLVQRSCTVARASFAPFSVTAHF